MENKTIYCEDCEHYQNNSTCKHPALVLPNYSNVVTREYGKCENLRMGTCGREAKNFIPKNLVKQISDSPILDNALARMTKEYREGDLKYKDIVERFEQLTQPTPVLGRPYAKIKEQFNDIDDI